MKINNKTAFTFLIFTLIGTCPAAQATVITFEEFGLINNGSGNGEINGNEWAASGVLFSTNGIALNLGGTAGSLPNSLGADAATLNDFSGNITIQFTGGASYTDVFFTIFNAPYQADAYSLSNTLLASLSSNGSSGLFNFAGHEVNRIEISGTTYAIDDLSFNGGPVPETVPLPAAVWLFIAGLLGLTSIAARRK